ncbi:MAG: hypothetical protein ACE5E5_09665 [Phycisphaerae bacterium]
MTEPRQQVQVVVVAWVADLVFGSRISATAAAMGVAVELVRSPDEFSASVERLQPKLSIVDLTAIDSDDRGDWASVRSAASDSVLIGFVPHVDTERAESAKLAGFDEVLPRSRFAASLPELLGRFVGATGS